MEELGIDYTMIEIDKTNKPDSFVKLYQRANPVPGVTAKVPVLHVEGASEEEEIILCESTVIEEYVAMMKINNDLILKEKQAQFWPTSPKERAKLRLFIELCGDSFDSYLAFSRVQDAEQLETQHSILQQKMREADAFLSSYSKSSEQFTLAEAHMAPFVQRCCGILPPPYDPMSIANDLQLEYLQPWIQMVLQRDFVMTTAPQEDIQNRREKLDKRLARIHAKAKE